MIENIPEKQGLMVTLNTTEDCNMRCKYCYEINKTPRSLSFDRARKFIDLIVSDEDYLDTSSDGRGAERWRLGLTVDLIGGDALMNPRLADNILTYLVYKLNVTDTERARVWRHSWKCSISSNGTLFENEEVRKFCEKWRWNLSLGVSVDGCREIHDKNRIMEARSPDGGELGSMDIIIRNWDWYRKTFPIDSLQTKATCARDSIPYLYDSLVFMHEVLGLKYINQNFIMEDTGCTQEDYDELRRQMEKCVSYVYSHRDCLYWSMLDKIFLCKEGNKLSDRKYASDGRCGSGCMPALSIDGSIYPCFRWLPHTQKKSGVMCVGNVDAGFIHKENFKAVREGSARCNCTQDPKCRDCEFEEACAYCIGGCYAEHGGFVRTTHICEITKIQAEYARKYWALKEEKESNSTIND